MIAFLTGRVAGRGAGEALLDVNGVGYRLWMSSASVAALPADGDEVTVYTYLHVREDELSLFGFESVAERSAFERLIGVTGVGPKVALSILSSLSPDALATAVATEDITLLSSVPGVGKKTAQRLCLELKDKLGVPEGLGPGNAASMQPAAAEEASGALLAMGFSAAEISAAVKGYEGQGDSASIVRHALKRLGASR